MPLAECLCYWTTKGVQMQNINFLRNLPQANSQLTVAMMNWILGGSCVVLLAISIFFSVQYFEVKSTFSENTANLSAIENEYNAIIKEYPLLAIDVPVSKQVEDLETKFNIQKEKVESIKQLTVRKGFSKYMFALAEASPNTLWLNQVMVNLDIKSFTVNGYAVNPDSVSTLMTQLQRTNAYKGITFNLFFVKALKNSSYVQFSIATNELGSSENADAKSGLSPNKP